MPTIIVTTSPDNSSDKEALKVPGAQHLCIKAHSRKVVDGIGFRKQQRL